MASAVTTSPQEATGIAPVGTPKFACSLCARRKVKCDKNEPCSNCLKAKAQCLYEAPAPPKPRKRAADEHLLDRLAAYEDLMRKHDVDFAHCASTWVPSEDKKLKQDHDQSSSRDQSLHKNAGDLEQCLWFNLCPELKFPPVHNWCRKRDTYLKTPRSLQSIITGGQPDLQLLHPESKHIYRLWQIFVDTVNPMMKVVHVPTLQQKILDASWNLHNVPKALCATMFAIYTLAVTSLSPDECQASFGASKEALFARYYHATVWALLSADFLESRDFEVLQAYLLFLFSDPESELTSTLTGSAVRIGQKMGLHRISSAGQKYTPFETEMRIRLWWQLCGLDARSRSRHIRGITPPSRSEFGDVRLPLNVNDADLHPDMTEFPSEANGPTEMMCVLVKFQVYELFRRSRKGEKVIGSISQDSCRIKLAIEEQDEAIDELETILHDKFFRRLDKRIPFHALTHTMGTFIVNRLRCKVHHPRSRAPGSSNEWYTSKEEGELVFTCALRSIEMLDLGHRSQFSVHMFSHMTSLFHVDPYIHVISELRQRCSGDQVDLAWKLIERLYDEHLELIQEEENTFYVALGELTLEAWEARRQVLLQEHQSRGSVATPSFIQLLWERKQARNLGDYAMATVLDPQGFDTFGQTSIDDFNWLYWKDLLQF